MSWGVALNGVYLSGGANDTVINDRPEVCADYQEVGCLAEIDGLGLPPLRTEDVIYAQRDGSRHFNDWYESRIITIQGSIAAGQCGCTDAAADLQTLMQAWKRTCCDTELVIFPDCFSAYYGFGLGPFGEGPFGGGVLDTSLIGPFGIVGRPRVATYRWLPGKAKVAEFTLRFDAIDQRIFILNSCGTPGYERCTNIYPEDNAGCVMAPLCSPVCATGTSGPVVDPTMISVGGTEVTYPELTLWPNLTKPIIENMTTLDYITYAGDVTDFPVIINTEDMTATQNGVSVTHLLGGAIQWPLSPGDFQIRLLSQSDADTGHLTVCSRDTVVNI